MRIAPRDNDGMRFVAMLVASACALAGCSFALVRGPTAKAPGTDPAQIKCTSSSIIPALDALGGAAAIGAVGTGLILEHTSEDGKPENFTLYYAAPLLAVAIAYFWAASFGTDHVEKCREVKETAGTPSRWQTQPIEPAPKRVKDPNEIEIVP